MAKTYQANEHSNKHAKESRCHYRHCDEWNHNRAPKPACLTGDAFQCHHAAEEKYRGHESACADQAECSNDVFQ